MAGLLAPARITKSSRASCSRSRLLRADKFFPRVSFDPGRSLARSQIPTGDYFYAVKQFLKSYFAKNIFRAMVRRDTAVIYIETRRPSSPRDTGVRCHPRRAPPRNFLTYLFHQDSPLPSSRLFLDERSCREQPNAFVLRLITNPVNSTYHPSPLCTLLSSLRFFFSRYVTFSSSAQLHLHSQFPRLQPA